jgi:site-specific DNA recombinase
MKAAIVYARVSTEGQADNGTSLDTQVDGTLSAAQRDGYTVLEPITDTASGATLDRPGLNKVRDMVRSGAIQAVFVHALDRLSREIDGTFVLFREFNEHGVKLISVTDPIENSTLGKLMLAVYSYKAEDERTKIAERTRRGKMRRLQEGRVLPTPNDTYGYDYNDGDYVPNEQATIVRTVFHLLVNEGKSMNAICEHLNQLGIPTPHGGTHWRRSSIQPALHNETYAGTRYHSGIPVTIREPIISREMFAKAQERLEFNKANSKRNTKRDYLLSGLIRCAWCHRKYSAGTDSKKSGAHTRYSCSGRNKDSNARPAGKCRNMFYRGVKLERMVWRAVLQSLTIGDIDLFEDGQIEAMQQEAEADRAALARLEADEKQAERARTKMLEAYQADAISIAELKAATAKYEKQRAELSTARAEIEGRIETREAARQGREFDAYTLPILRYFAAKWEKEEPSAAEKRRLFERVQLRVVADGDNIRISGLINEQVLSYADARLDEPLVKRTTWITCMTPGIAPERVLSEARARLDGLLGPTVIVYTSPETEPDDFYDALAARVSAPEVDTPMMWTRERGYEPIGTTDTADRTKRTLAAPIVYASPP